jgi:Fe-S cluster assembly protein SufD
VTAAGRVLRAAGAAAGPRAVCVNGSFDAHLSDLDGCPLLSEATGGGVAIVVGAGVHVSTPLEVVHVLAPGSSPTAVRPRTHIDVHEGGHVTVVERYVGLPGAGLTDAATTITTGPGAEVVHQRVEDEGPQVDHTGHTSVDLADGARVRSTSLLLGGRTARSACDAVLRGGDARLVLRGLTLATGQQHHEHVATVEHAGSRGASDQLFMAVVDGRARSSFGGHVIVRPGTTGTAAHQMSRNLVLARAAEATTRPWLEILSDEVQCTHGATVGRLSDEALHYLRSRGIPEAGARRMLITAFAREVIDGLEPAHLRTPFEARLERWLEPEAAA